MKKIDILSRLKNAGVIAVVRGKSKEEALNACHAIIKGGLTGIELTFTVPQAQAFKASSLLFPRTTAITPAFFNRDKISIFFIFSTYFLFRNFIL